MVIRLLNKNSMPPYVTKELGSYCTLNSHHPALLAPTKDHGRMGQIGAAMLNPFRARYTAPIVIHYNA